MMRRRRRQALAVFLGMSAASVLGALALPGRQVADLSRIDLETLVPDRFGSWRIDGLAAAFVRPGTDLQEWGYQKLMERTYIDHDGHRVMLSMAYGADQSTGLELHLPEICYRYAGFTVSGRHLGELGLQNRRLAVTRLVAELPQRPEAVTYWIVLGGESIADHNAFRLRRMAHAVRRNAADGLLVRVSSLDLDAERAWALQSRFVSDMVQSMSDTDRALFLGRPSTGNRAPTLE
jgi:EpsI family protein